MITAVARHELLQLRRNGLALWLLGLLTALLALSFLLGYLQTRDREAEAARVQAAERERWLGQGVKNPHSAAHWGVYAFRPSLAPSAIDPGLDPYLGVAVWIEAHKQNQAVFRQADESPSAGRWGQLSAAFVLQKLVPLVLVLLTFGSLAGERELGTLRQVLSLGVKPTRLVLGKALGLWLALSLVLAPAALMALLALGPSWRLLALGLVYSCLWLIWLLLGLAVSASSATSRQALLTLTALWFFGSFLWPRLASDLAAGFVPEPDQLAFTARIEDALAHDEGGPVGRRQALETRYHGNLPEGVYLQADEEFGYRVYDREYGALYDGYERQDQLWQGCALLAPGLAVQSLSSSLAGSDFSHQRRFLGAVESYRRAMVKTINAELTRTGNQEAGHELWEKLPAFSYQPPTAAWALQRQIPALAGLALWLAVSAALCGLAARRLRP